MALPGGRGFKQGPDAQNMQAESEYIRRELKTLKATIAALEEELEGYLLLAGRVGGQTANGGTAASENLTLSSTAHATKGKVLFGTSGAYDEANTRLGVGTTSPGFALDVRGTNIVVQQGGDNDDRTQLVDASTTIGRIEKLNDGGSAFLEINPRPTNGTSDATVRLFRETSTSGLRGVNIFRGDGTATIDHRLSSGTEDSYLAVASDLGIGATTNPSAKLHIFGDCLSTSYIRSNSATQGIGYATGAGLTVTQLTSKSTGVAIEANCGQITTHNAALANATTVSFVVTNAACATTDCVIVNHDSGGTLGGYIIWAHTIGAGAFSIAIRNQSGGSLSEALTLNFAIIKAVTS